MAITNNWEAGREMPRTKNQSKQLTDNSTRDRVYGQTARIGLFQREQWLEK